MLTAGFATALTLCLFILAAKVTDAQEQPSPRQHLYECLFMYGLWVLAFIGIFAISQWISRLF